MRYLQAAKPQRAARCTTEDIANTDDFILAIDITGPGSDGTPAKVADYEVVQGAVGGVDGYFEASQRSGQEGYEAVCRAALLLAEQGELCRRLGYDPEPMAEEAFFDGFLTPGDFFRLRSAVLDSILAGFGREIEDEKAVDLELLELDQKKEADPRPLSADGVSPGIRPGGDAEPAAGPAVRSVGAFLRGASGKG